MAINRRSHIQQEHTADLPLPPGVPTRFRNYGAAKKYYGDLTDFYAGYLMKSDTLADNVVADFESLPRKRWLAMLDQALDHGIDTVADAPASLRNLFAQVDEVPDWVDWKRMNLGARTYQRMGMMAPIILSFLSLMRGYHSSAAIKPLVFTGQLDRMAPRRLAETGKFVTETSQVNGLRRFAPGFKTTVRVRLIHAQVRRMLQKSGRWDEAEWGVPINQADMLSTQLSFSVAVLYGARMLGFEFDWEESEALIHLWRYSGYLNGIDQGILATSEAEAERLAELSHLTQPGPDEGSWMLAEALRQVPKIAAENRLQLAVSDFYIRYGDGLARAFAGDDIADELRLPNREWKIAADVTRLVLNPIEKLRRRIPGATTFATLTGNFMVRQTIKAQLAGKPPSFVPPAKLPFADRFSRNREAQHG